MDKGNDDERARRYDTGEGFRDDESKTGGKGAIPEGGQTSDLTVFNLNQPGGRNPAAV